MPWDTVTLNDGTKIPSIGFGSAFHTKERTIADLGTAIEVGFDHIDTSDNYKNEEEVGQAIKESGLARSEVYLTTKYSVLDKSPSESVEESLEKLGVTYVDLYLIHAPRFCRGDIPGTWKQMEELVKKGYTKSIGVSNFNVAEMEELLKYSTITPVVNQIQFNPNTLKEQAPVLEFQSRHNIVTEGYSPNRPFGTDPGGPVVGLVRDMAARLRVKEEQVMLAWCKAKGVVVVTSSSSKQRMESYLSAGDITLSTDDIRAIDDAGLK
ncbi:putative oxidoreductase, partial [Naematelia encephala]